MFRLTRATCVFVLTLLSTPAHSPFAQSTKAPQQPLSLPNPTPRPVDPHMLLADGTVARTRQAQAAMARRKQLDASMQANADQILALAQLLHEDVLHHDPAQPPIPQAIVAQKIEKLAKQIKEDAKTP